MSLFCRETLLGVVFCLSPSAPHCVWIVNNGPSLKIHVTAWSAGFLQGAKRSKSLILFVLISYLINKELTCFFPVLR